MANFIDDDERIILFDSWPRYIDRQGFIDAGSAGIKTALQNLDWNFVERQQGHYDWSHYDQFVDNCMAGGLKVLLITPNCVPDCMPDDWYCATQHGHVQRDFPQYSMFSPWNQEAQQYQDDFTRMVIERYASLPVRVIRGGTHGGESLLPYDPSYFNPSAVMSFRTWASALLHGELATFNKEEGAQFNAWESVVPGIFSFGYDDKQITKRWLREHLISQVVRQQSILVRHYGGEAWMMLASCWKDVHATGNFLAPEMVGILMEKVQPTQVNWIAFAHWNMNSTIQGLTLNRVKEGAVLWTGSQYCEGLPVNTSKAKASGIRGFVTGPLSIEDNHDQQRIEPWMTDAIRNSIQEWRS